MESMSRVSAELLKRWNSDNHSPLVSAESQFDTWWSELVVRSIAGSEDGSWYQICIGLLDDALESTMHATQSNELHAYTGLSKTMQAFESFYNIDVRSIPSDPQTFDVEDIQQTLLLIAFQYDSIMGTDLWAQNLRTHFDSAIADVRRLIAVSNQDIDAIRDYADFSDAAYGYDALASLDNIHWVIGMLEWLKLEDPRREIAVDLTEWKERVDRLESDLRPGIKKLRRGGVAFIDQSAPARFWWRH